MSILADEKARTAIRDDLDRTLFVEAGAGSGKTTMLVERVAALVLTGGIPLRNIAAVTFTEKAAAELRDRLRGQLEKEGAGAASAGDEARARLCTAAMDDLDSAAIGTLHSFAQRVLSEHPIEAGLPPLIEVMDEVGSQVAFEERWVALRAALLEDEELRPALLMALASDVKLEQLRSIARAFTQEWDRLESEVLATPINLRQVDVGPLRRRAVLLIEREQQCSDPADNMAKNLLALREWLSELDAAPDAAAQLGVLAAAGNLKATHGSAKKWSCDLESLRDELKGVKADAAALRTGAIDRVLRRLAYRIAEATLADAEARRKQGQLEFHDLLVLARGLVRNETHGAAVRATLQRRYRRLLLDEFQDTDPIQIELAVRIAGGATAIEPDWRDVEVPSGSLFVVGDPKQSIYRFRRADIATYLGAQDRVGELVQLTTNFRTTSPLLDWVNSTFATLILHEPDSQPHYTPLDRARADAQGGSRVVALGLSAHEDEPDASTVRIREAEDVAGVVQQALSEKWQVWDTSIEDWRDPRPEDIAILVPARTSLPFLEKALDAAAVPYRAETSSLVYRTAEVRDLLAALQALDDSSDTLAMVAALRSPLFGCGDDDLWTWKQAGGAFRAYKPIEGPIPDHPVGDALAYLDGLSRERRWLGPSELLERLVRDRQVMEVAVTRQRYRDVWRRIRFVVDQARAWSESEAGGLRAYLAWAKRQGDESARVAEAVLPETDADSVRVMTVHAAKGLEFPIVIVSGLSSQPGGGRGGVDVLWPRSGGYALKLGKDLQTGDFEQAKPVDEQMDHHERLRLLYVACTRARDHLVVSMHRKAAAKAVERQKMSNAALLAEAAKELPMLEPLGAGTGPFAGNSAASVTTPPPLAAWQAAMRAVQTHSARASSVSASSLEGQDVEGDVDPGLEKGSRNLELPPWNKGRYGTAIGRAVHGVLQVVDLGSGDGLEDAVRSQCLAEGVLEYEAVVGDLCRSALASEVVQRAAAREHWREVYVGTPQVDGTLSEGIIDLLYREDDHSLVVVDYKTDAVPSAALAVRAKVYRPQQAAYVQMVGAATGQPVSSARLLFLAPGGHQVVAWQAGDLLAGVSR